MARSAVFSPGSVGPVNFFQQGKVVVVHAILPGGVKAKEHPCHGTEGDGDVLSPVKRFLPVRRAAGGGVEVFVP